MVMHPALLSLFILLPVVWLAARRLRRAQLAAAAEIQGLRRPRCQSITLPDDLPALEERKATEIMVYQWDAKQRRHVLQEVRPLTPDELAFYYGTPTPSTSAP